VRTLRPADEILGTNGINDPVALRALLNDRGYLFLRKIINPTLIDAVRGDYIGALKSARLVVEGADAPICGGAYEQARLTAARADLETREPWRRLHASPAMANLLKALMGVPYCWLPLVTYRMEPPLAGLRDEQNCDLSDRRTRIHQDGYNNPHLGFWIFWLPLMHIDGSIGGLALAENHHQAILPHQTFGPDKFGIQREAIPDHAWASATFDAGDLVVLHALTPHSGLTNLSDRYRLSIDFRIAPETRQLVLGELLSIDSNCLSIRTQNGQKVWLEIDDETVFPCRYGAARDNGGYIPPGLITEYLIVGQPILATQHAGFARLVRGFDNGPPELTRPSQPDTRRVHSDL